MKTKYKTFCEKEKGISIFNQHWWLDAVCGEEKWDVVLVERNGVVQAAMPFYMPESGVIKMPPLTQTMGPWIRIGNGSYSNQLSREKELMTVLIDQLPETKRFMQQFHYSRTNWLPFYWKDFQQTTRYTYILDDLSSEELLWENFDGSVRSDVRKATSRFGVSVKDDLPDERFLCEFRKTFDRQEISPPDSSIVRGLLGKTKQRGTGTSFYAIDDNGRIHAVALLVWDFISAYYLLGSGDPELRNSGAQSLLLWEMIKFSRTVSERFDFEGSMIEPVERHFRAYGAKQYPYFRIFYDRRSRREKMCDRLKNSIQYRLNKIRV